MHGSVVLNTHSLPSPGPGSAVLLSVPLKVAPPGTSVQWSYTVFVLRACLFPSSVMSFSSFKWQRASDCPPFLKWNTIPRRVWTTHCLPLARDGPRAVGARRPCSRRRCERRCVREALFGSPLPVPSSTCPEVRLLGHMAVHISSSEDS